MGPVSQLQKMFAATRIVATLIMLVGYWFISKQFAFWIYKYALCDLKSALILTLVSALVVSDLRYGYVRNLITN